MPSSTGSGIRLPAWRVSAPFSASLFALLVALGAAYAIVALYYLRIRLPRR